uniref:Three-finger toxin MS3 n=1 Tax=Micrurus surinamensis TaxID=129470 RepID=3S13_MICSU|nr:RecName: Full=Three-finger toxin MS3; AltName: Full=Short neurotoxin MS3 [Micrurus surinamensis]
LICYSQMYNEIIKTCENGETTCYSKTWRDHRGTRLEKGCGCPPVKYDMIVKCCKTDRCGN